MEKSLSRLEVAGKRKKIFRSGGELNRYISDQIIYMEIR
jgi:hypothetical protein